MNKKNDIFDNFIPIDHSLKESAEKEQQSLVAKLKAKLPNSYQELSVPFIEKTLQDMKYNSSMLLAFRDAVKIKYIGKKQIDAMQHFEKLMQVVTSGFRTEEEMYKAKKERDLAKRDYETIEDDYEIQNLKKKRDKVKLRREIEDLENPAQTSLGARLTEEEWRQRKKRRLNTKSGDMQMLDEWTREALDSLDFKMHQELEELDGGPWSEEEKKRKAKEIQSRYSKQKENILDIDLREI